LAGRREGQCEEAQNSADFLVSFSFVWGEDYEEKKSIEENRTSRELPQCDVDRGEEKS